MPQIPGHLSLLRALLLLSFPALLGCNEVTFEHKIDPKYSVSADELIGIYDDFQPSPSAPVNTKIKIMRGSAGWRYKLTCVSENSTGQPQPVEVLFDTFRIDGVMFVQGKALPIGKENFGEKTSSIFKVEQLSPTIVLREIDPEFFEANPDVLVSDVLARKKARAEKESFLPSVTIKASPAELAAFLLASKNNEKLFLKPERLISKSKAGSVLFWRVLVMGISLVIAVAGFTIAGRVAYLLVTRQSNLVPPVISKLMPASSPAALPAAVSANSRKTGIPWFGIAFGASMGCFGVLALGTAMVLLAVSYGRTEAKRNVETSVPLPIVSRHEKTKVATLTYWTDFRQILKSNASLAQANKSNPSAQGKVLVAASLEIENLPTLDVDQDCVRLGLRVANTLREAGEFQKTSGDPNAQAAMMLDSFIRGANGDPGGTYREISAEQKRLVNQVASIRGLSASVRADLTARYGVEFPALDY